MVVKSVVGFLVSIHGNIDVSQERCRGKAPDSQLFL
jgi:hypothetical protein